MTLEVRKVLTRFQMTDNEKKLSILPCFASTFILFRYSLCIRLPILLLVKDNENPKNRNYQPLMFRAEPDKGRYEFCTTITPDERTCPLLIIECISKIKPSELKDELTKFSMEDIILANDAAHPQYPTKMNQPNIESDYVSTPLYKSELNRYIKMAHEFGFCKENPQRLFTVHFKCGTYDEEMALLFRR